MPKILKIIWFYITLILLAGCNQYGFAYTYNQYADAIKHAENNINYGVLKHYKHTTYRQACINTVRHIHRLWVKQGKPGPFTAFLGGIYCPVGGDNDNGTNKYWVKNVNWYLIHNKKG